MKAVDDLDPRASRYLALACQRTGDYDCALATLRATRDSATEVPDDVLKDLAKWSHYWALSSANAARRAELLDRAVADTHGWFEASPGEVAALRLHSDVMFAAERIDELFAVLLPRARSNENDCAARLILAKAYNALRDSSEATSWAREAISCDLQSVEGHLELVVAVMRQVRSDFSTKEAVNDDLLRIREATESVERARSLAPDNARAAALADDLRTATDRLRSAAAELAANDSIYDIAVADLRLEEIRERCRNILWKLRDETREVSGEDRAFYDKNDCKQYATP